MVYTIYHSSKPVVFCSSGGQYTTLHLAFFLLVFFIFLFLISLHAAPLITSKVCEPGNLISMIHKGLVN